MASVAVDTLSLARELRAAQFSEPQAEALAAAIGRSSIDNMAQAATKTDLAHLEAKLEAKIEASQVRVIMWVVSTQIAVGALIAAIIKL